jgi:hypothetical protein
VVIAIAPTVVSKLLDLVNAYAERNKGVTIKLSVHSETGSSVELEVPYKLSPQEITAWIAAVQNRVGKESEGDDC